MKTEEGFDMTVAISDPSAKTKRTDFSDSTLFIGGLSSETTEEDVRNLLGPVSMSIDSAYVSMGLFKGSI